MNNLKLLRELYGMTQKEVAQLLDVTAGSYSLYELGKRGISTEKANILCEYYDVSLPELMGKAPLGEGAQAMPLEKRRRQALVILKSTYRLDRGDMEFIRRFICLPPQSRRLLLKTLQTFASPEEEAGTE